MRSPLWNGIALATLVVGLAAGGPWLAREIGSLPPPATLAARAQQRIVTLEVGGMTCDGCAAAVERRLEALAGVETASVRAPQARAYVVCAKDVPDSMLVAAVRAAGPAFDAAVVAK